MAASEHSARCVFVDAEWREASGLHQDSSTLRPVLTGGGGEGERLRENHDCVHEGEF